VLYYCAKHKLVPTKDVCAQADEQFDSMDLFKDGALDMRDLEILQHAVDLEARIRQVKAAVRTSRSGKVSADEFVALYQDSTGTASEAEARAKFAELDKDGTSELTAADVELLSAHRDELVNPTLLYNRSFSSAKGDTSLTHPLVRVIAEESSREEVALEEARRALMVFALYLCFCFAVFRRWSLDLSLLPGSSISIVEGELAESDIATTVALSLSLLATLPAMIGDLPKHTQGVRALLIPLTIFAFIAVGQRTVVTLVRWVEQKTFDVLKQQHQRFLHETAQAVATATQWHAGLDVAQLPDLTLLKKKFDDIGRGFSVERMQTLEHLHGADVEAEVFAKGGNAQSALDRMHSMAELGGLRR